MVDFKGSQFEREIILWAVRWDIAYPISHRQLEEMMGERGVTVDHSKFNRWVITLDEQARFGKRILRVHVDVGRQRAEAVAPL